MQQRARSCACEGRREGVEEGLLELVCWGRCGVGAVWVVRERGRRCIRSADLGVRAWREFEDKLPNELTRRIDYYNRLFLSSAEISAEQNGPFPVILTHTPPPQNKSMTMTSLVISTDVTGTQVAPMFPGAEANSD